MARPRHPPVSKVKLAGGQGAVDDGDLLVCLEFWIDIVRHTMVKGGASPDDPRPQSPAPPLQQ
jgi:hypothetical protein